MGYVQVPVRLALKAVVVNVLLQCKNDARTSLSNSTCWQLTKGICGDCATTVYK